MPEISLQNCDAVRPFKDSIPVEMFFLVKIVLNPDFTAFQVFGANTRTVLAGKRL